jgi:two-component system, sensor histidine kinase PdtaS
VHQSGEVRVVPGRFDGRLRMEISDDGRGLPPGFDWRKSRSLGLSIVNTLVAELEGNFELGARPAGPGTLALVEIPL